MDNLIHQGSGIILISEDAFSQTDLSSYASETVKDQAIPCGLCVQLSQGEVLS